MNTVSKNHERTQRLVGVALFTAIVFVLQIISANIKLGVFSIASFALVTIVVGAAMYGLAAGAWLGFVFGVAVLVSGDAALFLSLSIHGTIITVLVKGAAAGFAAALAYRLIEKHNKTVAAIAAGIVSPIVNTGLFVAGCYLFFLDTLAAEASAGGYNTFIYICTFYVGVNFIVEFAINLVLNPIIIRLVKIGRKISN